MSKERERKDLGSGDSTISRIHRGDKPPSDLKVGDGEPPENHQPKLDPPVPPSGGLSDDQRDQGKKKILIWLILGMSALAVIIVIFMHMNQSGKQKEQQVQSPDTRDTTKQPPNKPLELPPATPLPKIDPELRDQAIKLLNRLVTAVNALGDPTRSNANRGEEIIRDFISGKCFCDTASPIDVVLSQRDQIIKQMLPEEYLRWIKDTPKRSPETHKVEVAFDASEVKLRDFSYDSLANTFQLQIKVPWKHTRYGTDLSMRHAEDFDTRGPEIYSDVTFKVVGAQGQKVDTYQPDGTTKPEFHLCLSYMKLPTLDR